MPREELEAAARRVLARPPRPPRDPGLFTSGVLFGQPGLYPDGPPMAPAAGPRPDEATLRAELASFAAAGGADAAVLDEQMRALADRCPEPLPRAALAVLATTVAAPLVAAFPARTTPRTMSVGAPSSPGRVVGPALGGGTPRERVVNERYVAEHPASVAPSLAHDLLWSPDLAVHAAETLLHALNAMVHLQLVARVPALAHRGTELCRRQNSLAITLCNSRQPGSERIELVAPDGPGTLPGGDPALDSPDFWSVPFAPPGDAAPPEVVRALAAEVFEPLVEEGGFLQPLAFSEDWGRWFGARLSASWLPPVDQLRAALALGLVLPADAADAAGPAVLGQPELADAVAVWEREPVRP